VLYQLDSCSEVSPAPKVFLEIPEFPPPHPNLPLRRHSKSICFVWLLCSVANRKDNSLVCSLDMENKISSIYFKTWRLSQRLESNQCLYTKISYFFFFNHPYWLLIWCKISWSIVWTFIVCVCVGWLRVIC